MNWTDNSKIIESVEAEICFLLNDSFYIGNPNNATQLQDDKFKEKLNLPSFERVVPSMARTAETVGNVACLADYYREIIRRSKSLGKSFNDVRTYFWIRLWLWNSEKDIHISFPWYDTLGEIQSFFDWVKDENEESPFIDIDQGWEFEAVRKGGYLYLRESDPDCDEEYANVAVKFEPFKQAVVALEVRAKDIIEELSNKVGHNYWTSYLKNVDF